MTTETGQGLCVIHGYNVLLTHYKYICYVGYHIAMTAVVLLMALCCAVLLILDISIAGNNVEHPINGTRRHYCVGVTEAVGLSILLPLRNVPTAVPRCLQSR